MRRDRLSTSGSMDARRDVWVANGRPGRTRVLSAGEAEIETGPVTGRAAILDLVRQSAEAETEQRRHHVLNVALHSGDSTAAQGHAYVLLTSNEGGSSVVLAAGFYRFRLAYVEGAWRIADMLLGTDNNW